MDNSSKRKFSLDSKSSSSGRYDLRFTRHKLNTNYKWCCCGIATFLTFLLLASLVLYVAYESMEDEESSLLYFRANFRVLSGDPFDSSLVDTNSTAYRKKTRSYKELINLLVRGSEHRHGFVGSEILALDGVDEKGMAVHFRLQYDKERANVTSEQLRVLFHKLVNRTEPVRSEHFNRLTIDPQSIYISEPGTTMDSEEPMLQVSDQSVQLVVTTTTTEAPPKCAMSSLDYCNYKNSTVYPNIFGHRNIEQVKDDLVRFREIVDSECHPLGAYEFVCKLLQPPCEDPSNVTLPLTCQTECDSFMVNCKERLSEDLLQTIDCSQEEIYDADC
ncbi:uncharacterized protein LOC132205909 [Neocloeon triangulifer]|uniref:uncharacterized protein LOC132205909 n=1 Tax=Neocloeon triangulifer TaxID=2078957 RepID=UPI00286F5E05|nr:uncharacterized protein LOC132205909 [Neocloeon triangulifer]XP_059491270.1 uncharacterized protein LOC132205909 [Neocloeon triangulifer]